MGTASYSFAPVVQERAATDCAVHELGFRLVVPFRVSVRIPIVVSRTAAVVVASRVPLVESVAVRVGLVGNLTADGSTDSQHDGPRYLEWSFVDMPSLLRLIYLSAYVTQRSNIADSLANRFGNRSGSTTPSANPAPLGYAPPLRKALA